MAQLYCSDFLPDGVTDISDLFDDATHPLSAYYPNLAAAQVDFPSALALTDQAAGAVVQRAWDEAASFDDGYRPKVELDAEGIGWVSRPLTAPSGLHFYGQSRSQTRLKGTFAGGPLISVLGTDVMLDTGLLGGGPIGDANGFILGNRSGAIIDVTDRLPHTYLPVTPFYIEAQIRWDSGAGYVWGLGNKLHSTLGKVNQLALYISAAGVPIAYGNDFSGGRTGPALSAGVFYTIRVTVNADGTGKLTIDSTDYNFTTPIAPLDIQWFTQLFIGCRGDSYPWVTSEGPPNGRVKNLRVSTIFGDFTCALTDGNTPYFRVVGGIHPEGFLFARPTIDLFGLPGGVYLHDFYALSSGGDAIYANNVQNSNFERLTASGGTHGFFLHKNAYGNKISDCFFGGTKAAAVSIMNAGQTPWDNCVFQGVSSGFAGFNSYSTHIRDGWIYNVSGTNTVSLLLTGQGATHDIRGTTIFNEGTDPRWHILLRNTNASFFGQNFSRYSAPSRPLIGIDGGGPYNFFGGQLAGYLNQSADPIFEKIALPNHGRIMVYSVDRSDYSGATAAPFILTSDNWKSKIRVNR